jgi:porin
MARKFFVSLTALALATSAGVAGADDSRLQGDELDDFKAASEDISEAIAPDNQLDEEGLRESNKIGHSTRQVWGGPNSVEGQLEELDRVAEPAFRFPGIYDAFEPWRDWKRNLSNSKGIDFNGQYTSLYQSASDSLTDDDQAFGGVLRLVGRWTLVGGDGTDYGALQVMLDHRHAIGDIAPASLASQVGYIGITGTGYSDADLVVVDFNWRQSFNDRRTGLVAGRYDPNDYMNIQGYESLWTGFSNVAILLDASIALPDAGWGIAAGQVLGEQWYANLGFNDANGRVDDDLEFFDGGAEFFKYAEIGWTPSREQRYSRHANVMVWHVDDRDDLNIDSAHGIVFGSVWTFADAFRSFVKLGISDGDAPIYNKSATIGLIKDFTARSDSIGVAVNWGEPPDNNLRDQITIETYWRYQFAPNLFFMPSVQLLIDPALNPNEDEVWVFGMRFRLTI